MYVVRTITERAGPYSYTYEERGYEGSTGPHNYFEPRKRDYWHSYERGVSVGDVRILGHKQQFHCSAVVPRWFGLLPPKVEWTPVR